MTRSANPGVPRVVLLAGGVGGARMALGLARVLPAQSLSILVNVGDDEIFHGLKVCPDIDTVLYTLSGLVDAGQSWGVSGDTVQALEMLRRLQAEGTWMKLGDADLGVHIHRTNLLRQGLRLTEVTALLASKMGVAPAVLPVTDEDSPTLVVSEGARLRFQEWFVRERAKPFVSALEYPGANEAVLTREAHDALRQAELIVIAPSNPLLSIEPMLALPALRETIRSSRASRIAISPLIGGAAVKGPLVKLVRDLGLPPGNATIAQRYAGLLDALVIDEGDAPQAPSLAHDCGLEIVCVPTLIPDLERSAALATFLLGWHAARRAMASGEQAP